MDPEAVKGIEKVVLDYNRLWKAVPNSTEEIVILALTRREDGYLKAFEFINCRNLSSEPSMFIADPNCIAYALALCKAINCIPIVIHSHRVSCIPSEEDKESMKLWNTVWLIISMRRKEVCAWLTEKDTIRRIEVERTDSQ